VLYGKKRRRERVTSKKEGAELPKGHQWKALKKKKKPPGRPFALKKKEISSGGGGKPL